MIATAMKNVTEQLIIVNNFFDPISIIIQSTIFYSLHLLIQPVQYFIHCTYLSNQYNILFIALTYPTSTNFQIPEEKKSYCWKGAGEWNIKMESTLEK